MRKTRMESAVDKTLRDLGVPPAGRKPDFRLKALNKATGEKSRNAGAAWVNENGSISIDVEPFVVLHGGKDLVLTLFPDTKRASK